MNVLTLFTCWFFSV